MYFVTNQRNFYGQTIIQQPNTLFSLQNQIKQMEMIYNWQQPTVTYVHPGQNTAQFKIPFNNILNNCHRQKNQFAKVLAKNYTLAMKPVSAVLSKNKKVKRNKAFHKLPIKTQVNKLNQSDLIIDNKVYRLKKSSCEDPFWGKYRIEKQLGKGGQGTVFLATNVRNGTKVAVKCKKIRTRTVKEEYKGEMLPKEVVIQMKASSSDLGLLKVFE